MKKKICSALAGIFIFLLFVLPFAEFVSEASAKDLFLYKLGGFIMLGMIALGFIYEANWFSIVEKINIKNQKHIKIWGILLIIGVVSFTACYLSTSKEFKIAMNEANAQASKQNNTELNENNSNNIEQEKPEESDMSNDAKSESDELPMASESTETNSSTEIVDNIENETTTEMVDITENEHENEFRDLDGCNFTFDGAVYDANGIEVDVKSITFEKTSLKGNIGYEVILEYDITNKNNENATLKFASSRGSFYCEKGVLAISLTGDNGSAYTYKGSWTLEPNEKLENCKTKYYFISTSRDITRDGVDYGPIIIDAISADEPLEVKIYFTGWKNETSETMEVTFYINQ